MAGRQNKVGLDYFELDCHMDEKIELIEAEFGLKGFAIVVKLYQSIYSGFGYYCEWTPDISLLWAMRLGVFHSGGSKGLGVAFVEDSASGSKGRLGNAPEKGSLSGFPDNLINGVVAASIRRGIFNRQLFEKYHILTSSGIQKRYFNAVSKREKVEVKKEYLLFSIPKNLKNVVINSISDGRNVINNGRNEQSKEEKSREKNNNKLCKAEALALFETLWKMYPNKKGKASVTDKDKQKLLEIGLEEMTRAIERYKRYIEANKDWYKPLNGSTFFRGRYLDYIGDDYEEPKQSVKKSSFNNFQQNDYDFEKLEEELLDN